MVNNLLSKKNRHLLFRWIGSLTAVGLMIILFHQQGWAEILVAFRRLSIGRFGICLVLIFISRFAVAARWYFLLHAVDDISFSEALRLTFSGLFATNFLPTTIGGDVVRFWGTKQNRMDVVVSAASLIMDRLVGMLGMALMLPFGARSLFTWISADSLIQPRASWGISFPWIPKISQKIVYFYNRIIQAFKLWSNQPKSLFLSFTATLVHMLCFFGAITLLFDGLGEPLSLGLVGGLWSFVYFVTLVPISINGYGVQEISMTFIFSEVGGISLQSSLAVSVLFRTLVIFGSIPGVVFVPGIIAGAKVDDEDLT